MELSKEREEQTRRRLRGCSADVLKWVSFICVCLGSASVLVQDKLNLDEFTTQSLREVLSSDINTMLIATVAVIGMLLASVAIPVYAKLLFEGWKHTKNQKLYIVKLLAVALVSEFFYDWLYSGTLVDMRQQNPVWALAIGAVMLAIFNQYCKPGAGGVVLKLVITVAGIAWVILLQSYVGVVTVLLILVYSLFEKKKNLCTGAGVVVSMLQFPAPFGMLLVHWYDGTKGNTNRLLFYILYPAQLALFALIRTLI